ncbi:MAG: putative LPS assembly protein LptD [Bacteroidia bacterium]
MAAQQKDTIKTGISSALDQAVKYSAADSMKFDMVNELVYLYDSAQVEYGDISLAAAYIIIDFKNNLVTAEGYKDSTGRYITDAEFVESGQTFHAQKMTYNYLTRKGKIIEISTQQGDSYILADAAKKDSSNTVYIWKGQYTTCDLDHPHFAIRTRKMKVIPDDKIVTGPAYLEIADVPTPLAVPFGFFPNKKGRASGILIPTYGESPQLGFFLKDGGYYWGINDKIDMAVRGDIYSKGSWGAKMFTNYRVRYKYSGNLALRYSQIQTGDRELPTRVKRNDFFINWTHLQDQKSNPSVRFSANVNAGTSTYNTFNANRPNDYLANTFQSNIAWSKSWKLSTLAANLRHSQNTVTRMMDMTLPQLAFTVNRFYPFRNPNRVESKWYDKIGISYVSEFQNSLNIADSLISINHPEYVRARLKTGIRQSLPVATSFNVLKYFTLSPSFTLNSVTQFRTIRKTWDNTTASIITDTVNGARINYDWNAALSFSTRIFGMYFPKHSRFSAIRHTATPALSLMYMPDFTDPKYGFYKSVQNNTSGGTVKYSIFEGGLYGSSLPGKIGALGFSLQNSLEGKLRPKNDSDQTSERRMLFDALNVAFSYNFMADNFNWSNISAGFRTKLFRKIDVNTSIIADPYKLNENGVRIEQFEWKDKKRIARLTTANLALSTSLRKGGFTASSNRTSQRGTEQEMNMINANPNAYVDFNVPWSLNVMYNLSWSRPANIVSITQSIRFSGDVNVTPKWKVGFDSSYDLQMKKFGYTSLNVYRDLHCWEMQFNWIPFGFRQSYNITINVKSAVLQDLKLTRKRDWFDFAAQ